MGKKISIIIVTAIVLCFSFLTHDYIKLLLIPLIIFCIEKGRQQSNAINPYYCLIPTIFSFVIYNSDWAQLSMMEIPSSIQLYIVTCLYAFFFGCLVKSNLNNINKNILDTNVSSNTFWIIFFVGLFPSVLSYIQNGNVFAMEGDAYLDARANLVLNFWGNFILLLPASAVIACKENNSKHIIISSLFSIIVALYLSAKTSLIISAVIIAIGLVSYKPDILQNKYVRPVVRFKYVIIPVLAVLFFFQNNNSRVSADGRDINEYISMEGLTLTSTTSFVGGLYMDYLYYSAPWSNLCYNIEYNHSQGYGANTFSQIGQIIGIHINKAHKIQPASFNVHTYLTDYYLDFGLFGSVIASFILGIFVSVCYTKCCYSKDPILESFWGITAYSVIMLFFSNQFNEGFIYHIVIFLFFSILTRKFI